jgi:hypothetical protein
VKLQERALRRRRSARAQVLGVNTRATYAGEIQMEALGERRLKRRRDELDVGVRR